MLSKELFEVLKHCYKTKRMVASNVVLQIKSEYINGNGSIHELADKYGESYRALEVRGSKEKWKDQRESFLKKIEAKSMEKAESQVQKYLEKVSSRSESYQDLIDKSIATLVGAEGCIDPDAINAYSKAIKTLDDIVRRSKGLVDPSQRLDVTSGGKTIGESLVEALAKLRANPDSAPALTDSEIEAAVECEIVD